MNLEQQGAQEPVQDQDYDGYYDEFGDIDGDHDVAEEIQQQLPPVVNHGPIQGANMNAPGENLYNQNQQEGQGGQEPPRNDQVGYQQNQQGVQNNPQN